ncbi:AraC family transcriptional regulator [Pseudomonas sp. GD03842]|uniref:AraC family transcriptional regulator n=1 Tax=unclassified Pseudomonas TaxID=196821 RepID=UPI000D380947|nr:MULTISPECIES: AraC family transcriptional regulator [unclassified Pseudomonas]MDH0748790.1 AraC family transcriptional regulator [Pseudomonas sp. GD03842]RAU44027.1 AraC family transcriptional regulator [Pseudomonas sp. RIT 409]RAU54772.1 AraC family transcriptional regulator [Pseudomonas sp. RIT 412]
MQSWTPYHDTEVFFDGPQPLSRSNILDASAREIIGSASGHYQARTVRPSMQYFDCDLRFTEPLRIHKVLPDSLCIVQVLEGGWSHSIDRRTPNHYTPQATVSLGLSEPMEAVDILPAGSHARLAGLRIAGSFIHEQAEEGDTTLLPLLRLQQDGVRFTPLPRCMALRSLFERLYQTPYHGALGRLHQESLTLAVLVELAVHLGGPQSRLQGQTRAQRELAHEARQRLEDNLAHPPASQELARMLGVGETTLRRAFKQAFGRSMLHYLRDRRLEVARQLLRERKWQVAQVAYRVGYADPANFTHAYKARFGYPPRLE